MVAHEQTKVPLSAVYMMEPMMAAPQPTNIPMVIIGRTDLRSVPAKIWMPEECRPSFSSRKSLESRTSRTMARPRAFVLTLAAASTRSKM